MTTLANTLTAFVYLSPVLAVVAVVYAALLAAFRSES